MKKILFLLLCTVQFYGQTSNGSEQEFDYGIKNNSTQTITTPTYIGTFGTDGTQGKIPSAYIEKTDNKQNSLAIDGTGVKYPTVDAVNFGLASKENPSGTFNVINNGFYNAFPGCAKMSNGNLICVYRKGTSHALDKGDIMKIISSDNGRTWSTESLVFSHATLDVRDPSITLLANNNLLITYFTYNISTLRYLTYVKISTDNGVTWGGEISVGGFNYDSGVSSPAIQLGNGDLLLAIYGTDTGDIYTSNKVVKSTNSGISWTTLSTLANGQSLTNNYSEPSLVLLSNGNILALNRNETDNNLHSAISTNSAITWGALSIAKPGISRASLLRMDNNNVLMTYRSYDNTSIASWKPTICTISSDGTVFGEENLFDLKSNTLDVYSSIVKISQGRYGIAYCLEFSGTRSDLFFRYINEIELVKDVYIVQGISSYDNAYFKKSLYIKEDLKANGYAIASGFKTPTGTSSQFLKADGSIDNGAFAPISGSVNYIHNQFSSAQTGNFWINGLARFNNTVDIDRNGASGDFLKFVHPTKVWSLYMDSGGFYIKNLTDMNYPLNILPTGGAIFLSTVTATSFNGSATLTGTPTAPTAALGTNTTQIATTAFVAAGLATKQNTLTNPITGTGTTNYMPKFTASGTVGNSSITDNGSLVSVMSPQIITDILSANNAALSGSALSVNQTWNTTGNPTTFKINVDDVTSGSSSLLVDFKIKGISSFIIDKNSNLSLINRNSGGLFPSSSGTIRFQGQNNSSVYWSGIESYRANYGDFLDLRFFTCLATPIERMRITPNGAILINTPTENGIDKLLVNGTISANAGTTANQVVVKSQLDGKVSLTGNETVAGNKTLSGTTTLNETIIREGYQLKFPKGVMYQSSVGTNTLTGNRTVSFPDASGTIALVETVRPYKVYTALLSQSGTSAPTATVLENTLSGSITWTYTSTGSYVGTLTSAFTLNKTWAIATGSGSADTTITLSRSSDNTVNVSTLLAGTPTNGIISPASIEIRVYN